MSTRVAAAGAAAIEALEDTADVPVAEEALAEWDADDRRTYCLAGVVGTGATVIQKRFADRRDAWWVRTDTGTRRCVDRLAVQREHRRDCPLTFQQTFRVVPPVPKEGLYKLAATICHSPTHDPGNLSEMLGYVASTPIQIRKIVAERN